MELKKILIASAIFNVFIVICFASLAAYCSGKYYALNKVIRELNKTISGQKDKLIEQSKKLDGLENILLDKSRSCKYIKDFHPNPPTGTYKIEIDGKILEVWCEMNSASGGWTVFQRRFDGTVDFNRNWDDYQQGFGSINSEFWLGLKYLNKLTETADCDLRVEFTISDGENKYAEYKNFRVAGSEENYRLSYKYGSYSGDGGDGLDKLNYMEFSTFDADHDRCLYKGSYCNCAASRGGGFWWNDCGRQNINGIYGWHDLMWYETICWDKHEYFKKTQLMIRPAA